MNFVVQVARKPTELLGLVVAPSPKSPAETWEAYGDLCREHATALVGPETLAALVQAESAGDPLARTYWRFRWTLDPLEIWAPASSAVGLLQITDGTFEEARHLCVHGGKVAREGGFWDPDACFGNALYFRTVPSHAIEMTSARLHLIMEEQLVRAPRRALPPDLARLAAVIHLCGRDRGAAFAARSFAVRPGERCGDHSVADYLAKVDRLRAGFAARAAAR